MDRKCKRKEEMKHLMYSDAHIQAAPSSVLEMTDRSCIQSHASIDPCIIRNKIQEKFNVEKEQRGTYSAAM